jgi:hypothetical protein
VFAVLRIRAVSSFVVADDIATPLTGSAESSSASAILATNARAQVHRRQSRRANRRSGDFTELSPRGASYISTPP